MNIAAGLEGHWNNIQHNNLNSLLRKELDNLSTNTSSTASDQNDLLRPNIVVLNTIVKGLAVQVAINPADKTKSSKDLNTLEGSLVEDSKVASLPGEAREENEWDGESWVEKSFLDEGTKDLTGEACEGLLGSCSQVTIHGDAYVVFRAIVSQGPQSGEIGLKRGPLTLAW